MLDPDSVITNLSDHVLSELEKLALANGLNFCLPPPKLKSSNYLSNFELLFNDLSKLTFNGSSEEEMFFRRSLAEMALSSYFNFNSNRAKLLNLPRDQFNTLKNLSKNQDIIITKPDKGSGIVIMNKSEYISKVRDIISDTSKFKLSPQQDIY